MNASITTADHGECARANPSGYAPDDLLKSELEVIGKAQQMKLNPIFARFGEWCVTTYGIESIKDSGMHFGLERLNSPKAIESLSDYAHSKAWPSDRELNFGRALDRVSRLLLAGYLKAPD